MRWSGLRILAALLLAVAMLFQASGAFAQTKLKVVFPTSPHAFALDSELNPDFSTRISIRTFDFGTTTRCHHQHSKHLHLSVVWFLKNFRLVSRLRNQQRGAIIGRDFQCVNPFSKFSFRSRKKSCCHGHRRILRHDSLCIDQTISVCP